MSASRDHPDRSDPLHAELSVVERFLVGRAARTELTDALRSLARRAPGHLRRIRKRLEIQAGYEGHEEEILDLLEALPDYLALGDLGPSRMPEVRRLLDAHPDVLAAFAETVTPGLAAAIRAALAGAASVPKAPRPASALLRLTAEGWALGRAQLWSLRDRAESVLAVGAWSLRLLVDEPDPVHLGEAAPPLRGLSIDLGPGAATLILTVVPELQKAQCRTVWNLRFELAPVSRVQRVVLALGTGADANTGFRSLRAGHPVVFEVDPPRGSLLRAHLEWRDGEELRTFQVEIPVEEGHGGRP